MHAALAGKECQQVPPEGMRLCKPCLRHDLLAALLTRVAWIGVKDVCMHRESAVYDLAFLLSSLLVKGKWRCCLLTAAAAISCAVPGWQAWYQCECQVHGIPYILSTVSEW